MANPWSPYFNNQPIRQPSKTKAIQPTTIKRPVFGEALGVLGLKSPDVSMVKLPWGWLLITRSRLAYFTPFLTLLASPTNPKGRTRLHPANRYSRSFGKSRR